MPWLEAIEEGTTLNGARIAKLRITLDGPQASTLYESLSPEISEESFKSTVKIELSEEGLTITIKAEDTSSLRASLNTYLRWIDGILGVQKAVQADDGDQ